MIEILKYIHYGVTAIVIVLFAPYGVGSIAMKSKHVKKYVKEEVDDNTNNFGAIWFTGFMFIVFLLAIIFIGFLVDKLL